MTYENYIRSFKPSQNKITKPIDVCLKFLAKCSKYSMTAIYHYLSDTIQKQQRQHPQVTGIKKNTEKTTTKII